MPNHITNKITVLEGQYDLSKLTSFNDVVPMPIELKDTSHGNVVMELEKLFGISGHYGTPLTLKEIHDKYPNEDIAKLLTNFREYGHITWYSWSIANWGTKWDMYSVDCNDNVLTFETAWSTPIKWIEALAKTLEDGVLLQLRYADEDIGYNTGIVGISNKGCVFTNVINNSQMAWELAIDLKELHEDVHFVNGQWEFKED